MSNSNNFYITDVDKEWVHEVFEWMVNAYGYPDPESSPILFTSDFFPISINHKKTSIEPLLADLCNLFSIPPSLISFEVEEDIRDTHGTPYEIQGAVFECDLEIIETGDQYHFKLIFANSLLMHPKRLVFNAVFQFIKISLANSGINWVKEDESNLIYYLIGIYTGCGVLLSQTMQDTGKESDGFWERSWKYTSPMPIPVMAYSMALYSDMIEEKSPSWINYIPPDIKKEFENALQYIGEKTNPFYNKHELSAKTFFKTAYQLSDSKKYVEAAEIYQKAIFLPIKDNFKAVIYNNWGYALLCNGDFQKSISRFQKALELDPNVVYAYSNMGFAFIMLGDTTTGLYYHNLGEQTGIFVKSYSYRTLAMYHQKKGEFDEARKNFQKSFENITIPVDWLEYLYARFLYEQGEYEESLSYLQIAVNKGEPHAIQWMKEIKKQA